ncbi:MAG TPA: hypothetical protein VM619_03515 [Luteimonas sp.]|nr:hypothetical protein [Luteimonas sp.]
MTSLSATDVVELECLRSVAHGEGLPDGCDAAGYLDRHLIHELSGRMALTHQGRERLADLQALAR